MRKILNLFLLILPLLSVQAQDQHFTQFFASPLTLNPALTGAFDGRFRFAANYRSQWPSVMESPFLTMSGAVDTRFNLRLSPSGKDAWATGLVFYTDKVSALGYSNNQMVLTGAVHKSLNPKKFQYLSLGYQFGVAQRNINYENLNFPDQFNGVDQYSLPGFENLPLNNKAHSDMGVGLNYSSMPRKALGFVAGVAIFHLLQPKVSFYDRDDTEEARLGRRYAAYFNLRIPMSSRVSLMPRAMINYQNPSQELNLGSNLRWVANEVGDISLHLGAWGRMARDLDSPANLESVILLTGIEYRGVLLGISYDLNMNSLANYNRRQGAFELSIGYSGSFEDEDVICPRF